VSKSNGIKKLRRGLPGVEWQYATLLLLGREFVFF
jgi:hypothetical protein